MLFVIQIYFKIVKLKSRVPFKTDTNYLHCKKLVNGINNVFLKLKVENCIKDK